MNEELMEKVITKLEALSKEYGTDRELDDIKRLAIPNPDQGLALVRKFSFIRGNSFSVDDISIIEELRRLLAIHRCVWVIADITNLRLDIYIHPDGHNALLPSGKSGGRSYLQ